MNTKAFVFLLVGVLVLGGALGGAFVGGMAMGGSQESETTKESLTTGSTLGLQQESTGQQSVDDLRQRFQSGDVSPEDMANFRQQFQGQGGTGTSRAGFAGRTGLTGDIESIEGNTVTVNTPQGPLRASIGEDTVIQRYTESTLDDLAVGMNVTVTGALSEDGTVEAISITVVPEGQAGVFGGRPFTQEGGQSP